jgi:hypothetical protein
VHVRQVTGRVEVRFAAMHAEQYGKKSEQFLQEFDVAL